MDAHPGRHAVAGLQCCWGRPAGLVTVANSADTMPGSSKTFNSFNQPSVNSNGLVVLRGRSKGQDGQPAKGIYSRDMSQGGQALTWCSMSRARCPAPTTPRMTARWPR
jgi:hypothetical protein